MSNRFRTFTASAVAAVIVAAIFGVQAVAGQTAPAPKKLARPAAAKPNFTGIWQALTTADYNIEDHQAEDGIPAGQGIVEGGSIPYKPEALAKRNANAKDSKTLDPENICYAGGVPRSMYMPYPFQILQSENFMMIVFEYGHQVRRIHMDGETKHPAGFPGSWMGDSRAKWDGETLVIDNATFNDQTWFDRAGNYHTDALKVVERISFKDKDHLHYEATIEDPNVFTRPWKVSFPLYRRVEKHVQLLEYPCVSFLEDEYVESGKGK